MVSYTRGGLRALPILVAGIVGLIALGNGMVFAQSFSAALTGTVKDISGAVLTGAKVTIALECRGANGLIEEVPGIQSAVAQIFEDVSMHLIGPRVGHHADLPSGALPVLGAISVGENVELPHGFHAQQFSAGPIRRNELTCTVPGYPVDSVDHEPVGFRPFPRHGKHVPV